MVKSWEEARVPWETTCGIALLVALIAPLPAAQQPSPPDYAAVLHRCEQLEKRNPLRYHIQGWEELAATRDPRAIAELAARYAKPPLPKEESQYLIAVSAATKGGDAATMDAFDAWRKSSREPKDAWLWYQALVARARVRSPDELALIAREEAEPVLRGAAIEALASYRAPLYRAILEASATLPKAPEDQCALIGALAMGLSRSGNSQTRVTSEWQKAAYSVITLLEHEEVPRAAKLVIARHLAKALGAERVVLEADAWRALLAGRKQEAKEKRGQTPEYARPRFFGVEASGERICYVIDLSDSMCEPIPEELKAKHAGPITPGEPKEKKGRPDAEDIPWNRVVTRFDLAREHLRLSLERLSEEQSFCIVTFGDRAQLLEGMGGMTKATHANTRKAMKALDEIKMGAALPDRPNGTLLGQTNMHAALRTAFRLGRKGLVEKYEYVDRDTFLEGCDTIFLLSDGDPTCDDYTVKDVDYSDGGWTGDPESGESHERTPELNYYGPYSNWERLLEDAKRLNMFRQVEIHCISIGDADVAGLSRLAEIGLGTVTRFDT